MVSEKTEPLSSDGRAFSLDWNLDHLLPDLEEDGWLVEFPGSKRIDNSTFWGIKERPDWPERVEFNAVTPILDVIDYPYMDVRWPIMSKKMLNTLLSVGNFRHTTYPVVLLDAEIKLSTRERVRPDAESHNYVVVHLLENLDVFDLENSIYEYSKRNPSVILSSQIKKAVFREPPEGFPPLFRVPPLDTRLYVSAVAQAALAAAGIRGITFRHVSDDRFVRELSLP